MSKALVIQNVGGHNEGRFLAGHNLHFVLIHLQFGDEIPHRLIRGGLFFRAASLLILSLCFPGERGQQPGRFPFHRLFPGLLRIVFTRKGLLGEMPKAFLPVLLGFLHLVLHLLLGCKQMRVSTHDDPAFFSLRQSHRADHIVP